MYSEQQDRESISSLLGIFVQRLFIYRSTQETQDILSTSRLLVAEAEALANTRKIVASGPGFPYLQQTRGREPLSPSAKHHLISDQHPCAVMLVSASHFSYCTGLLRLDVRQLKPINIWKPAATPGANNTGSLDPEWDLYKNRIRIYTLGLLLYYHG